MPSSVKIDEATLVRDLARGAYGGFVVVDDEVRWCGRWCDGFCRFPNVALIIADEGGGGHAAVLSALLYLDRAGTVHSLTVIKSIVDRPTVAYRILQFMHMEDLYVRPAYRRKGYGKVLWRAAAQVYGSFDYCSSKIENSYLRQHMNFFMSS